MKLPRWIQRILCLHTWTTTHRERYDIIGRRAGEMVKTGEVTITVLTCIKCGKDSISISDRI